MMSEIAPIAIVGITDAGRASLGAEALALIEGSGLLCGGERHLAFFADYRGERFTIRANVDELVGRLARFERPAVVLASGDPTHYGIGPLLAERLGHERVRIVPN